MTCKRTAFGGQRAMVITAVGVLAAGWPAVLPARAATSAAPAVGAVAGQTPQGTCSRDASGVLVSCPAPVSRAMLPAAASNQAAVPRLVKNPAALVDTRTWTSSGGNTFPGADMPFGMVQWSPDTVPHRNDGGGYTFSDRKLTGYSLTHLSGPGCPAAGDIPILPMTGLLPNGNPSNDTTSFTNSGEAAQAGYYSARSNQPNTITSRFSATPHSAMGTFEFPETSRADFLIKLRDSQTRDVASSARIVGDNRVQGSATTGHFCNNKGISGQQDYTVHFVIVFNHRIIRHRIITERGQKYPNSVLVRFTTRSAPLIKAKVAISYVSAANAMLDWRQENGGWDLARVRAAARRSWNALLGRIQVSGGSYARTQEFYSLLYKDLLQPNITSDVNGQYLGSDLRVHTLGPGQANQYGMFSGWDTYHSLAQLQAIVDPGATGNMAQSLLNYYAQNGILPQWGYLNLDNYAMVGDPADSIISDYYSFGVRNFDTTQALADMVRQATTVNTVRPGEALESRYGFLPQDGTYGCCNARGSVASLLEYDSADFALARFAAALGDTADATMLERRADDWTNVFDAGDGLLNPRLASGAFLAGIRPTSTYHGYLEGDAYEYLWDVPNNYAGLFARLGGDAKVVPRLQRYLSRPAGLGMYAQITNEFDLGEQNALDYAGDPAGTQQAVSTIRNDVYLPGPDGMRGNDDLGAESSQFIWEMLGIYPENPGSDNLVLASPGFPKAVIHLPDGKVITINAPRASPTRFYVGSLKINGRAHHKLYVPFSGLARGSTMDWTLRSRPGPWGSAPQDAPPSYGAVSP